MAFEDPSLADAHRRLILFGPRLVTAVVGLVAFLTFVAIQLVLETARFHSQVLSVGRSYGSEAAGTLRSSISMDLVLSSLKFAAICLGALVLVARGWRWIAMLPAVCAVLLPWLINRSGGFSPTPLDRAG
jgi:hypothetical protein